MTLRFIVNKIPSAAFIVLIKDLMSRIASLDFYPSPHAVLLIVKP